MFPVLLRYTGTQGLFGTRGWIRVRVRVRVSKKATRVSKIYIIPHCLSATSVFQLTFLGTSKIYRYARHCFHFKVKFLLIFFIFSLSLGTLGTRGSLGTLGL